MLVTHLKHQKQSENTEEACLHGHAGCPCCLPGIRRGTERGTVLRLGFISLKDLDTCVCPWARQPRCAACYVQAAMTLNEHGVGFSGLLMLLSS